MSAADHEQGDELFPKGDWDRIEQLARRLEQGERLYLDEDTRELLRIVGADVALAPEFVAEHLTSVEEAEVLLREERARIRDGSQALGQAILTAWKHARAGEPEEGYAALERAIQAEPVPWYRECARRERNRIRSWVDATRTEG
jgi:DUSAM domain-containing protein